MFEIRANLWRAVLGLGLGIFSQATVALTENESKSDVLSALRDVRSKIEQQERRISTIEKRKSDLELKLEKLRTESEKLQSHKAALSKKDADFDGRVRKLEIAVEKGKLALEDQRAELNRRVVAVYKMQRRAGAVDYLITSTSATDLMRRLGYLTRIANADRSKLDKLSEYVSDFEREKLNLEQAKKDRATNLENLLRLEKELGEKTEETAALVSQVKSEEEAGEAALSKMEESASKLESVLAKIMGSEELEKAPPEPAPTPVEVAGIPKTEEPTPVVPFEGSGLEALKGKLSLPVQGGKLVQHFGKQKHEEFSDMLFVKGLEFQVPAGSKVKAVAAGKIALSQVLPGYGNVVILDHGKRHYTLYGRLASSSGQLGQTVKAGDEIAVLGEPDKKGRNFYFELRLQGKPVNPIDYFRDRPPAL